MELKEIDGFNNYMIDMEGNIFNKNRNNKKISYWKDNNGYKMVVLFKNNKKYYKRVHVLVAKAFIPNPNNLPNDFIMSYVLPLYKIVHVEIITDKQPNSSIYTSIILYSKDITYDYFSIGDKVKIVALENEDETVLNNGYVGIITNIDKDGIVRESKELYQIELDNRYLVDPNEIIKLKKEEIL